MQLPEQLSAAIAEESRGLTPAELARASAELSGAYRGEGTRRPVLDRLHRAAYLTARLPATYAVVSRVLREAGLRLPELRITNMLDLGAGPGTAMWAAAAHFPEIERIVAVEDSPEWIALGRTLAQQAKLSAIRSAEWVQGGVAAQLPSGSFDLVIMSYVINELHSSDRIHAARTAWEHTGRLLVIADPGTPGGFGHIREVRRELIVVGAHMVAPCPHVLECPMHGGDWCHFAARVQRSSEHRMAKGGELGYEDEKYSYVVFAREPIRLPAARILRHPRKHSGHVDFELCTRDGLQRATVSRKQGERYKAARKAEWGDAFE